MSQVEPNSKPRRRSAYAKPVIGVVGGVGSGKSVVAAMLAELGCAVIDSDRAAHEVLREPAVKAQVRAWWGEEVFGPDGELDRKKVAAKVFGHADEVAKLNGLVHPRVRARRDEQMAELVDRAEIVGFVWDTPLLFEVGLDRECDAVIFVKAPWDKRLARVRQSRGWSAAELNRREKLQLALDKKQELADYSVDNSGEASAVRRQVREILSQIKTRKAQQARQ